MKPLPLVKTIGLSVIVLCFTITISAQTIGTFSSVTPTAQVQTLVLPSTHTFQRIIKTSDPLSLGGTLGANLDFTGYVPVAGSSTNGRLSISSESTTGEVAIVDVSFNTSNHLWVVGTGGKVTFNPTDIGTVGRFCSGTVTPNNTIMVSEEDITTGNVNSGVDGYTDRGWIIEINPVTRTVINQTGDNPTADKLWALGRSNRENAVIRSDNMVLYTGADDPSNGYIYKFVPTVPGVFSSGLLYVLRTTAGLGTGTWKLLPNTTVAERNGVIAAAAGAPAAYNFNGVEDVEIAADGKIYFTAKGEGKIYRFTDNGTVGTGSDVTGLEVYAGNSTAGITYDVNGAAAGGVESWGIGNDNLAFDGEGNLWVLQDGSRNHIWVISPAHTQASPQVRLFATTPAGCEPTGITFTPDYKYMFLSFQHPNANTTSQTDAAGTAVIFNTHTTVVIARTSALGPLATLPVTFTGFDARLAGEGVAINWSVTDISNHDYFSVERSVNGTDFEEIHRNNENINGISQRSFIISDNNLPTVNTVYYRIKQCDINGSCRYTNVKAVKLGNQGRITRIYPQPANDKLNIQYYSFNEGFGNITVTDINGKVVMQQTRNLSRGAQSILINTNHFGSGIYMITVTDKNYQKTSQKFIKE